MSSLDASRLDERDVRVVTNVEAGCDGRGGCARRVQATADGEIVWSWRPDAGADPVMMCHIAPVTVTTKPGLTEEITYKP